MLTGVVVGLGGKASATSRGQSIKNFVKYGKKYILFLLRCIVLCQCTVVLGSAKPTKLIS